MCAYYCFWFVIVDHPHKLLYNTVQNILPVLQIITISKSYIYRLRRLSTQPANKINQTTNTWSI